MIKLYSAKDAKKKSDNIYEQVVVDKKKNIMDKCVKAIDDAVYWGELCTSISFDEFLRHIRYKDKVGMINDLVLNLKNYGYSVAVIDETRLDISWFNVEV